ncbi:MAG: hypothetical protein Ct9H300mP15_05270 [Gemmatimonadota bacterium]|nr:MAG: hypothetical protein Ct9H300mP15_05270 [Gemmatimonadota bacterium]
MPDGYRIEKDSLGEMRVPEDALYGAQTQRAVENFPSVVSFSVDASLKPSVSSKSQLPKLMPNSEF